ncbi:MFS transporter [Thermoactinomyces daqus]|uniref:MFS transporter n=1 Tax=Thermoactinomyces daqus TaxID=1329516 RepID=UPI000AB9E904|nr:MFS transporter [Thermoactinomyces daqus]
MHLPESPRWLEAAGRLEEANQIAVQMEDEAKALGELKPVQSTTPRQTPVASFSVLWQKRYRRYTLMLWFFHILQTIGYYGFGTLVPLILKAKGYTILHSLEYTALTFLGYPLGSLLSANG